MSKNEQENEKRETVADIVAEMRQRIAVKMGDAWYTQAEWRNLCDRIEAAWKRERQAYLDQIRDAVNMIGHEKYVAEHSQKPPVGNAAAMREALENLVYNIELRASVFGIFSIIDRKTFLDANSALSAPARNCDRFADETDAQIAFLNEVWLISVTKETALERDRFENWTDEMRSRYAKWLLAPAAERKGEGEGDGR